MEFKKEAVVDGHKYLIQHPQVEVAWDVGVELMKLVGPSLAAMSAVSETSVSQAITHATKMLMEKLSPKESMALIKKLLSNVEAQGEEGGDTKKVLLNEVGIRSHFHGRPGAMIRLVGEVIEFTHADFFDAISDGVAKVMAKASSKIAA
jgi:hypothetical protein